MDQNRTPLFTGLLRHIERKPIQFHIPGHKAGIGMNPEFREFIGTNALSIDLINIAPLDDLHHPKGMILEAEQLAAEAFGSDVTFFSVQGTSGAIMTMIMSVCGPGEKIIVPRNVHKSVMSAIIFSGAIPIFVHPVMDSKLGISHGITVDSAETALSRHPDAKAILVINPTYFGVSADLVGIVQVAREYNIPVLVDEAHGAHIHFHDQLPISAMEAGADMSATSVHKLGGSLTQTSILNVREGLVSASRVKSVISMLTTTSTSYILLASLDTARKQLATVGAEMAEKTIQLAEIARQRLNEIPGIYCVGKEILGSPATFSMDPTKLIIHVKDLGISGNDVEIWLRNEYQIEVELSDLYNILCVITPGDSEETIGILIEAMNRLARKLHSQNAVTNIEVELPKIPALALTPRDAFYSETEVVPLRKAQGRIIAEFIMIYPPGIPVFLPGGIVSQENIEYICKNLEAGLPVQGPEDESIQTVRVIKRHKPIQ